MTGLESLLTPSFGQIIQNLHRRLDVGQHTLEEFFLVAESLGLKEEQIGIEKSPVVSKASLMHSSSTESLHTADSPAASPHPHLASISTSSLLDKGNSAPPTPSPSRPPRGSVSPAPQTSASSQPIGGEGDHGQILDSDGDHGQHLGGGGDHGQPLGGDGDHGQPLGGDGDHGQPLGGDGDHGQAPVHVGKPQQSLRVSELERICPVCLKRFHEKNLKRHMKTHEKLPMKTCGQCGAKIGRGDSLRRHSRRCPR